MIWWYDMDICDKLHHDYSDIQKLINSTDKLINLFIFSNYSLSLFPFFALSKNTLWKNLNFYFIHFIFSNWFVLVQVAKLIHVNITSGESGQPRKLFTPRNKFSKIICGLFKMFLVSFLDHRQINWEGWIMEKLSKSKKKDDLTQKPIV